MSDPLLLIHDKQLAAEVALIHLAAHRGRKRDSGGRETVQTFMAKSARKLPVPPKHAKKLPARVPKLPVHVERMTLSRHAQRSLKTKKYKLVRTSFLTRDNGPTKGTIWWDAACPTKPPRYVASILTTGRIKSVVFTNLEHETLDHFLLMCDIGQYVLIGVLPETISHTET